jgi:hypothetical protein
MLKRLFSYFRKKRTPLVGNPYRVNIQFEGRYVQTSFFFPSEWTPEQVLEQVSEAYSNFFQQNPTYKRLRVDGQQLIKGFANNGMYIEMLIFFDKKKATIKVAYPKFSTHH